MNWLVARAAATSSIVLAIMSILHDVRTGGNDGSGLFFKIMLAALFLLILSGIFVFKQRTVDWRELPEKQYRIKLGGAFLLLLIIMWAVLAFRIL